VANIGTVANTDGQIDIQIRDLDQTIIDNPAHDLSRLALSLATAARGSDLPGVTIATMLEEKMVGYQRALVRGAFSRRRRRRRTCAATGHRGVPRMASCACSQSIQTVERAVLVVVERRRTHGESWGSLS
jgi:uncharacterized protein (DUF2252 family)